MNRLILLAWSDAALQKRWRELTEPQTKAYDDYEAGKISAAKLAAVYQRNRAEIEAINAEIARRKDLR